jgi:phospholipase/carboxylesterase
MEEHLFHGTKLMPKTSPPRQLFILLHDAGAHASELRPLANQLRDAFPDAAFLLPEGSLPADGSAKGHQWFSQQGLAEQSLANAVPALYRLLQEAQTRLGVLQTDTALVGFGQGAILALEFCIRYDGSAGRVLAFSGRFAKLPERAPELTTVHLFHGERDDAVPVSHAYAAYDMLESLGADVTLDIAASVGHALHPTLVARAISRLQTCVPLRTWLRALGGG